MCQVVDLYVGRQIEKINEAGNAINKLASKNKKTNIVGLQRLATSKEALPATGKLIRYNQKRAEKQNYFIQAHFDLQQTFRRQRKGTTKLYDKIYTTMKSTTEVIRASSKSEAIKIYEQQIKDAQNKDFGDSYDDHKAYNVDNITIDSITVVSSYTSVNENNSIMKRAYPVKYDFIPADDKYLTHQGLCVIEQIDNIYGKLVKQLNRDNFISHIKAVETEGWNIQEGVKVSTLNCILKPLTLVIILLILRINVLINSSALVVIIPL